jgi:nitrogen fixation protein FixH
MLTACFMILTNDINKPVGMFYNANTSFSASALVAQNKYVKDAEINVGAKLDLCKHCM